MYYISHTSEDSVTSNPVEENGIKYSIAVYKKH